MYIRFGRLLIHSLSPLCVGFHNKQKIVRTIVLRIRTLFVYNNKKCDDRATDFNNIQCVAIRRQRLQRYRYQLQFVLFIYLSLFSFVLLLVVLLLRFIIRLLLRPRKREKEQDRICTINFYINPCDSSRAAAHSSKMMNFSFVYFFFFLL